MGAAMDGAHGIEAHRTSLADLDSLVLRILRLRYVPGERDAAVAAIAAADDDVLLAAVRRARRLEVGPLFAREILHIHSVPAKVRDVASQLYRENLARNLFLKAETNAWVSTLREAGIPCRILKGVYVSELLYEDLGAKTCADIDIFVRHEDLDRALTAASARGFSPSTPAPGGPSDPSAKAYTLTSVDQSAPYFVDLHWDLEVPMVISVNHAALWEDTCPADLLGALLCLHLWRHCMSLKTLLDFAAFVSRQDEVIPAVYARFKDARARDGVTLALSLVHRVLGVRSRYCRKRYPKQIVLPWLESCVHLSAHARGTYLHVLVSPLRFDGLLRPVMASARYLLRSGDADGRLRLGRRVTRLAGAIARAASAGPLFTLREMDHADVA